MAVASLGDPVAAAPTGERLAFDLVAADRIAPLVPEWTVLAGHAAGDNVFFHPDFALPAMAAFGAGVEVAVVSAADRQLAALAPVATTRLGRIAPAARLWAHAYAPHGLPLVDRTRVVDAVAALVGGVAPSRSLVVPDLPLDGAVAAAFLAVAGREDRPVAILDRHVRAVIGREAGIDRRALLAGRRRKEFGRLMRRLGEHGRVTFESRIHADDVRSRFEVFMALEAAGWKGRRGTALLSSGRTTEFGREAVRRLADAGSARIDSIDLDGAPVAMVVTFAAGVTAWTWKIAYEEAWARYSPGAQLMLDVPAGIFSDPTIGLIDSLATADHPMIDHLWDGRLEIGTMVLGPPGGSLAHRAGLAAARAEMAAKNRLRALKG